MSEKKVQVAEKELDRLKAENRGFIMAKCFNKECFELFVIAINNLSDTNAWDNACRKANLTAGQKAWLYNYLKEYKPALAWNQSSAMNGW